LSHNRELPAAYAATIRMAASDDLTSRTGFRERTLGSRLSPLQLRIPKLCQGSYFPPFLERLTWSNSAYPRRGTRARREHVPQTRRTRSGIRAARALARNLPDRTGCSVPPIRLVVDRRRLEGFRVPSRFELCVASLDQGNATDAARQTHGQSDTDRTRRYHRKLNLCCTAFGQAFTGTYH